MNDFEAKLVTLKSPDRKYVLQIIPETGGCITRFDFRNVDGEYVGILRGYDHANPPNPLFFGNFPLTPFSNRIGYGKMSFEGSEYDVGPLFMAEKHPNHGDGWTSPWEIESCDEAHLTLRLLKLDNDQSPYKYEARQVFSLSDQGLSIAISIKNIGDEKLPFGTGHHFYFPRINETILETRLGGVWQSEEMVPVRHEDLPDQWNFAQGKELSDDNLSPAKYGADGTAYIDHCFTGWDGQAAIKWPRKKVGVKMEAGDIFRHFVIFVPKGQDFFCAEPVSNATDGFNLMAKGVKDTGSIVLDTGQSLYGDVRLKAFDLG